MKGMLVLNSAHANQKHTVKKLSIKKKAKRKSKTKAMKKSDRESLLQSLQNINEKILQCDVIAKLTVTFGRRRIVESVHKCPMFN